MSKQSEKGKPSPLSEINIRSLQISIGTGEYCDGSDSEHDLEIDGHDECEMVSGITTLTRDVDQGPQEPIRCKRGMFLPCLLFIVCVSAVLIIYWKGGSDGDGDLSSMTVMTPENQNGSSVSPSSSAKANTKSESVEGNVIEFTVANLNTNTNKCTHVKHVLQCIPSHNEATNKFRIRLHPEWGPIGVSRFQDLTTSNFWRDIRIFRVVPDFISQFGISSYPDVQKGWSSMAIQDDPVIKSNDRGTVSFATSGENTRSTQLFINTNDNWYLDTQGFAPIGEVLPAGDGYGGMEVVNEFQNQYGEKPNQAKIREEGEDYLRNEFPLLSYFVKADHCAVLAPCSRLATLLSAGEDAFVRDLLRERSIDTAYIGLWHEKNYSQESRNSTDRTQQEFSWFDGTKIEYSNWAGGEPNDWTDYQLAGFLRTSNGYWYDHFVDDVYLELGSSVTGVCKYVPTH